MNHAVMTYLFETCNQIKQFTSSSILEDHEYLALSVNELKQLDCVRIVESSQDFKLSLYLFKNTKLTDLLLVENLDCYLMTSLLMIRHYRREKSMLSKYFVVHVHSWCNGLN